MEWDPIPKNPRYDITKNGDVRNHKTGRVLTGGINGSGYRTVHIDHYDKPEFVHRLVAETYIANDDPVHKTDVNHKDGNKMNNCVDNLEWVSRSYNIKHAYDNGLNRPSGGGSNKRKVRIVETGETFISQEACANAIGGSIAGVSLILNGKRKKDTYKGYHLELV